MTHRPYNRTAVLACGSNVFGQIHSASETSSRTAAALSTVKDAASIVAVSTCQTVVRDRSGRIRVLGEGAEMVEEACRSLFDGEDQRKGENDELIFVGQDMFDAILDVERSRCYFLQYDEGDLEKCCSLVENSTWKTAAADARGRCMAIDVDGRVFLFDSFRMFRDATGEGEAATKLKDTRRFNAHAFGTSGSVTATTTELPKFDKVSAGNAHFVLLARMSEKGQAEPVWIFGDARFGAVPLQPFEHSTTVGLLSSVNATTSSPPTDVAYLMPLPYFSAAQGFPCRIADAISGDRHALVLTADGDLYGWGWNEDACLLPFADSESQTSEWENNIVYEPTLIPLPPSTRGDDDLVALTSIACSNGRSFGITTEGRLVIAGSNEFDCLGVDSQLQGLTKKPRFEREFSQIKKPYDCVDGFQLHPDLGSKVIDVGATSLATFVTVETE